MSPADRPPTPLTPERHFSSANYAHEMSVVVDNACRDVPHDIGLKLWPIAERAIRAAVAQAEAELASLRDAVREWRDSEEAYWKSMSKPRAMETMMAASARKSAAYAALRRLVDGDKPC